MQNSSVDSVGLTPMQLRNVFPYHVAVNEAFEITQLGNKLMEICDDTSVIGMSISDIFDIKSPSDCTWEWNDIETSKECAFNIALKPSLLNHLKGAEFETFSLKGNVVLQSYNQHSQSDYGSLPLSKGAIFLLHLNTKTVNDDKENVSNFQNILQDKYNASSMPKPVESDIREIEIKQSLSESKKAFLRYICHELRNPLNVSLMGINLLEEELNESICQRSSTSFSNTNYNSMLELIAEIKTSSLMAVEILTDLTTYESIDSSDLNMDRVEVKPRCLIKNIAKLFTPQAREANIALNIQLDNDINHVLINADVAKLSQVLRNLVSNALKFTPAGGHVTVGTELLVEADAKKPYEELHPSVNDLDISNKSAGCMKAMSLKLDSARKQNDLLQSPRAWNAGLDNHPQAIMECINSTIKTSTVIARTTTIYEPHTPPPSYPSSSCSSRKRVFIVEPTEMNNKIDISNTSEKHTIESKQLQENSKNDFQKLNLALIEKINNSHKIGSQCQATTSEAYTLLNPCVPSSTEPTQISHTCNTPTIIPFAPENSTALQQIKYKQHGGRRLSAPTVPNAAKLVKISRQSSVVSKEIAKQKRLCNVDYLRIYVKDTGVGISAATQKVLFEEFKNCRTNARNSGKNSLNSIDESSAINSTTTSNTTIQQLNGSGLGLLATRSIVEAHGGSIGVYSKGENQGAGSVFYVDIPISNITFEACDDEDEVSYEESMKSTGVDNDEICSCRSTTSQPADLSSLTCRSVQSVLVVDDVKSNRSMLTRLLKSKKIDHVEEAVDGSDAIEKYKHSISGVEGARPYDVIMMDYVMPVMDGPTATKELRMLGYKGLIVGVTGNAVPEDIATFLKSGVNKVFLKPLDITKFMTYATYWIQCCAAVAETKPVDNALEITTGTSNQNRDCDDSTRSIGAQSGRSTETFKALPTIVSTMVSAVSDNMKTTKRILLRSDVPTHSIESVLVVDDIDTCRRMLTRMLQSKKVSFIEQAVDGSDAIVKYKHSISGAEGARPYDVIMMDFSMPVMDGPTATKELRRLGYKGLIVGVTGNSMPEDIERFMVAGVNKVFLKPLNISDFMDYSTDWIQHSLLQSDDEKTDSEDSAH